MRDQALLLLKQASADDADAAFRAGATAVRQGIAEEAIPLMEAAARNHPQDARIWQVLGLAYRNLEEMTAALEALEQAARLAPHDALIAHTLARATMEAGLPASALFDRAHGLAPGDASILLGRAAAQFAEGRREDAIAGLDHQLAANPGWLLGHVTVSRLRWMCGDQEAYAASLDRALGHAPGEVALWRQLAGIQMQARHYDRALLTLARARATAGDSLLFDSAEAACWSEKGETGRADPIFRRIGLSSEPSAAESYVRHLLRSGRPAEAAAIAESRLAGEGGLAMWPYLASAWRLTGDVRWEWLEGHPRFIGVYDIGDKAGSLEALAGRLRSLHVATHQPLEQSVRGGTQTDGPLFARIDPEIRSLRSAIVEAVQAYIAQLPPADPGHPLLGLPRSPVRFSGSWSVRLTDGGHHANHVHLAGWISSAFYVSLPDSGVGGADHAGWLALGEASEVGVDLPPLRLIEPKPGRLILFPSTMWPGTRPFEAGERLTVAFDVARPPQ